MAMVRYEYTDDCIPMDASVNPFIAAFTTCHARLTLLDTLHKVGSNACYYDTDSCIYLRKAMSYKVPLGELPGVHDIELDCASVNSSSPKCEKERYITEFVSGGPKNYAYTTDTGSMVVKVRGFTLNYQNSQIINFQTMKDMVLGKIDSLEVTNPSKITRDKKRQKIINKSETKLYKTVYTKRHLLPDYNTIPYGY